MTSRAAAASRAGTRSGLRRQRYLRLLTDVTAEFAAPRSPSALFGAIARRCAQEIGDWCVIGRVDTGRPGISVDAVAHRHPARADRLRAALRAAPRSVASSIAARLLAAAKPLIVSAGRAAAPGDAWTVLGITSAVVVPFAAGGGGAGFFAVGGDAAKRWDDEQVRTASVIAERVGVAVRQAHLLESERRARAAADHQAQVAGALLKLQQRAHAEEKALSAVVAAIAGETDLGRGLTLALEPAQQLIHFTGASIVLVENGDLIVRAAVGPHAGEVMGQAVPPGEGPIARVLETGQPFHSQDCAVHGVPWGAPARSCLVVPLRWQGRPLGALEVHAAAADGLEPGALPLMQRIAAMVSGWVELTHRYATEAQATAEVTAARRQLTLLAEASRLLATALDVDATLRSIMRLAVPALADWCLVDLMDGTGSGRCHIFHADPQKGKLAGELPDRLLADRGVPRGARKVMRTRRAEIYPEASAALLIGRTRDARYLEILRALGLGSAMIVPFMARGRMIGALTLVSGSSSRRYGSVDLALAEEIARRAALALDNAMLHEAEQEARRLAEQAADRAARLQAITAALSRATTRAQVADVIAEQGVRALDARAGLVSLVTDDGSALEVLREVGFSEDAMRAWRRIPLSTLTPITEAVKSGHPVFFDEQAGGTEPPSRPVDASAGSQDGTSAAIPLVLGGSPLGVLMFEFRDRGIPERDRAFLRSLAQLCAQAFDRARLYEREHRVAETLQRAFLPAGLPDLPGVAINAAYVPGVSESEIGGDWYDVFQLPDGRVALSIGDVVGRGLEAAVIMGQVRQSIRAAALEYQSPFMVLDRAGRVLHLTYEAEGMATAVFGILDPVAFTFTYSTAGHPAPLLVLPDGEVKALDCGGLPLGVESPNIAPAWIVPVPRGSLLVLYTDGLVESTRNVVAGEQALFAAAQSEAESRSLDPARAILDRMIPGGDPPDDVAVLTIGVSAAAGMRIDLSVHATPAAGRIVRQALRRFFAEQGVATEVASALEVALGEAFNNTVEHAYGAVPGSVDVAAWRDSAALVLEVRDHGRWRPERIEDRGHGLQIMRALTDAVDLDVTPSGTTIRLRAAL